MTNIKLKTNQKSKLNSFSTTSAKMRYLSSLKMDYGQISKTLNKRYQHVRNVMKTEVKNPKESIK